MHVDHAAAVDAQRARELQKLQLHLAARRRRLGVVHEIAPQRLVDMRLQHRFQLALALQPRGGPLGLELRLPVGLELLRFGAQRCGGESGDARLRRR